MKNFYFQEMRAKFYLSFTKIGSQPTSARMFCKLKMMFEIFGYLLSMKNSISQSAQKHIYFPNHGRIQKRTMNTMEPTQASAVINACGGRLPVTTS